MGKIVAERVAPAVPEGAVTFLIGMRINRFWQVWKWAPVVAAMTGMLIELQKSPDLGLCGRPRTFVSGRLILVWQQWASFNALEEYAKASEHRHVPAWRSFNKRSRGNASVGIFHETHVISPGSCEGVYVNMPLTGLGAAFGTQPADGTRRSARQRLHVSSD